MAKVMIISLCLLYGALIIPVYGLDDTFGDCSLTISEGNNYNLTVSPTSYKANSSYSVTINGSISNTTILFQVINSTNSYVENGWGNGTSSCNGVYFKMTADQTSLTTNWNSPSSTSVTSVTIKAYIRAADNNTSMLNVTLTNVDSTTSPASMTIATSTSTATTFTTITAASKTITTSATNTTTKASTNSTSNNATTTNTTSTFRSPNNISTTTTTTISKTTSSASTVLSSRTMFGIIQVMALAFLCHLTS
ncbi:integumentary mucin C.1 [Microcaecilia unicolor]|uniref:Integumentary mucin C.1-like n=1 Tax=Microcaecilia unicolor TaxID=1415580 RepID=A0A6P7ZDW6_9AMPH|nr:integumentary mucin C.1-like [Microcaecilia unicolor]